jgi:redox-sensitive bicupin YhaK (pirin superfamily)
MPAVTVEDTTTLPRTAPPAPRTVRRRVRSVTTAPSGYEGEGFPVRRAFAGVDLRDLDPFIHLDQMGEVEYAPGEPKGTSWHPHRGFETVTYILDGTFEHADSHGGGGTISNGDTQWMTAGGGVLHIEKPPEALVLSGGLFHGLQLWVNLPRAQKWVEPRYQDLRAAESALLTTPDGGALLRVIAGEVPAVDEAGARTLHGPGSTYTPMAMVHATVSPGATLDLPWRPDFNALVYVLSGSGSVGIDGHPVRTGQLALLGPGDTVTVRGTQPGDRHAESRTPALDVVVLGGQPIREPIAMYGPFVMNTRQEVMDAYTDFSAGRLGTVPAQRVPHAGVRGETPGALAAE